jgi:hypothetical protein
VRTDLPDAAAGILSPSMGVIRAERRFSDVVQ